MTDRYDILSNLFQDAIAVFPVSFVESRQKYETPLLTQGDLAESYIDRTTRQYNLTPGTFELFQQKIDIMIREILCLFDTIPTYQAVKDWMDNRKHEFFGYGSNDFRNFGDLAPVIAVEQAMQLRIPFDLPNPFAARYFDAISGIRAHR